MSYAFCRKLVHPLLIGAILFTFHFIERSHCDNHYRWNSPPSVINRPPGSPVFNDAAFRSPCESTTWSEWILCEYDELHCRTIHAYLEINLGRAGSTLLAGVALLLLLIRSTRKSGLILLTGALLGYLGVHLLDTFYYDVTI